MIQHLQREDLQENYFAFLAVADAIRTSLGPKGMDKMVSDSHM